MKKKILFSFIALTLILSAIAHASAATSSGKSLDPDAKISKQQMEAQIYFFNSVLLEFAAPSPDRAVELWVKGDQTRNGVYKYAVADDLLKQRLVSEWGTPEKSFWIIGGSSPWLTRYSILSKTELSPTEIQYVVQYEWATSAGPETPSTEKLTLQKTNAGWYVKNVIPSDGYHSY
ncbi:MAG: hypothetical protein ACOX7O_11600 [Oscillospiraceae bacterium]|jgi:hypothetical protein